MLAQNTFETVDQPGIVLQPSGKLIFDGALFVCRVLLPDGRRMSAARCVYSIAEIVIVVFGPVPLGECCFDLENAFRD